MENRLLFLGDGGLVTQAGHDKIAREALSLQRVSG